MDFDMARGVKLRPNSSGSTNWALSWLEELDYDPAQGVGFGLARGVEL